MESFKNIENQLKNRQSKTLKNALGKLSEAKGLIINCPSDLGVCRNGGRRGAKYAPEAIWAVASKMQQDVNFPLAKIDVSSNEQEVLNFVDAQKQESLEIEKVLGQKNFKRIVQVGGGHDHIYPLLKAISQKHRKITVINIDAHCDTRTDELPHSGTPFRQFDKEFDGEFELIQLGIHKYANTKSTVKDLDLGKMKIHYMEDLNYPFDAKAWLHENVSFDKERIYILSLDADGMSSSSMEAVSAVNHYGLETVHLLKLIDAMKEKMKENFHAFGIYEYNPVLDNTSQKGARTLSSLIYQYLYL